MQILGSALSIWDHKQANKYRDKFSKNMKALYEEENKARPDDIRISDYKFELRLVGHSYASEVEKA